MAGDWSNISDLWWLQPKQEGTTAIRGLALGAQIAQQRTENDRIERQSQLLMQQKQVALQNQETKARGLAAMSSYMAKVAANNEWTNPKARAGFYELAASLPFVVDDPTFNALESNFTRAEARADQAKQHERTKTISELDAADVAGNEAKILENLAIELGAGKPGFDQVTAKARGLREREAILKAKQTPTGEDIKMYDAAGNLILDINRGRGAAAAKEPGTPTQAVMTETQKQGLAAEAGVTTGIKLFDSLTESDVGVRGFVNEYVVNRGIAQIFPELHDKEVASGRALMRIFNERMKKSIKADAQLNEKEQQRLEQALPSLGGLETVKDAKDKIAEFIDTSRQVTRINATRTKVPIPDWAWTQEELAQKFSAGEITEARARELLKKYHYKREP